MLVYYCFTYNVTVFLVPISLYRSREIWEQTNVEFMYMMYGLGTVGAHCSSEVNKFQTSGPTYSIQTFLMERLTYMCVLQSLFVVCF